MDSADNPLISPSTVFGVVDGSFWFYFYNTFGPLISFVFLTRFYMLSHSQHVELSWQLKVNLIVWQVSSAFTFALYVFMFGKYATPIKIFNLNFELIRGSLHIASTNAVPLSTTFLLLDRILVISFVGQTLNTRRRHLKWFSVIAICLIFFVNFYILIYRTILDPAITRPTCTLSCRITGTTKDLLFVKMAISILNVIFGGIFVYLYLRYSRKLKFRAERKFNHTTLFVFISEIFFTILPTGIYLIGHPYSAFMNKVRFVTGMIAIGHVTDGLATTALYWMTRINSHKTVLKLFVNPNPAPKVASSLTNKKTISPTY